MNRFLPAIAAFLSVAIVIGAPLVVASSQQVKLAPGDSLTVTCTTRLSGNMQTNRGDLACAAAAQATPTNTPVTVPTATPTAVSSGGNGLCPQSVHDRYVVTGPDGRSYPTWHPAVDPSGCVFGHEHGADPRTSHAANSMPPFGYAAATMGMTEPHVGFKVFIMNAGDTVESNINSKTADEDIRFVFHMGTGGIARYTQQFHSFQIDYVDRSGSGRTAHLTGMTDTGPTDQNGSTCSKPRRGAKDFADLSCGDTPYEIWNSTKFQIIDPRDGASTGVDQSRFGMVPNFAVFDPITTRDPSDNNRLVYTSDVRNQGSGVPATSPDADYQGCEREFYAGPLYFHNAGQQTVYFTDAFGRVSPSGQDAQHPIRQQLSASNGTKIAQFKMRTDYCGNGIRPPN
jgi:hypothetical protein